MIDFTAEAQQKVLELWESKKKDNSPGLLIKISGRGPDGFDYVIRFVREDEDGQFSIITKTGDLPIWSDESSVDNLKGSTIDFNPARGGFNIDNPNPLWVWSDPLEQAVQDVLTSQINPGVASHGGMVQLLEVKDNVAYIEMGGGCVGCGMADVTLKQGIEVSIKATVPEIVAIVDTTDHASGTNPYYQQAKGGAQHQPAKGGQAPSSPFS